VVDIPRTANDATLRPPACTVACYAVLKPCASCLARRLSSLESLLLTTLPRLLRVCKIFCCIVLFQLINAKRKARNYRCHIHSKRRQRRRAAYIHTVGGGGGGVPNRYDRRWRRRKNGDGVAAAQRTALVQTTSRSLVTTYLIYTRLLAYK